MVSARQTALKYHGRKAATYDEVRQKQARWHWENEHVERWLRALKPESVLDCPVGTGRFLDTYRLLAVPTVYGVDVSEEMIALARQKLRSDRRRLVTFEVGSAMDIGGPSGAFDVAVCVRFLDLIDEEAMVRVVTELCRVAERAVVLTIRLGDRYVPKSNTAEHDKRKFAALVKRLGWRIEERVPFRDAGWELIRLTRGR